MHLSTKVRWNIRPKKNQKNKRNVLPLLTLGERRSSNNYCVIIGQCRLNYFVGFHSYGVCVNRFLACQKYYAPLKYFIQKTRYPSVTGRYWFDLETGQYRVLAPVPPRKSGNWKRIFFGLRLKLLLLVNQDQCIKLLFCLWGLESNTKKFNSPSQAATLGVMGFPSRPHHKSWRKRRKLYVLQHPHIWGSLQFMQL